MSFRGWVNEPKLVEPALLDAAPKLTPESAPQPIARGHALHVVMLGCEWAMSARELVLGCRHIAPLPFPQDGRKHGGRGLAVFRGPILPGAIPKACAPAVLFDRQPARIRARECRNQIPGRDRVTNSDGSKQGFGVALILADLPQLGAIAGQFPVVPKLQPGTLANPLAELFKYLLFRKQGMLPCEVLPASGRRGKTRSLLWAALLRRPGVGTKAIPRSCVVRRAVNTFPLRPMSGRSVSHWRTLANDRRRTVSLVALPPRHGKQK